MNDCDCGKIMIIIRCLDKYIFELCNIEKWHCRTGLSCKHRHGRVGHVMFWFGLKECLSEIFKPKH